MKEKNHLAQKTLFFSSCRRDGMRLSSENATANEAADCVKHRFFV